MKHPLLPILYGILGLLLGFALLTGYRDWSFLHTARINAEGAALQQQVKDLEAEVQKLKPPTP